MTFCYFCVNTKVNIKKILKFENTHILNMIPTTKLRESIFRHLDGITIAPVAINLKDKGVLEYLLKEKKTTLTAWKKQDFKTLEL